MREHIILNDRSVLKNMQRPVGDVTNPLLEDLVVYYNLDEASGTRADSHINGLDLTDNNTVSSGLGVDGVSTAALFEKDTLESLSRTSPSGLELEGGDFSFFVWANHNSTDARYIITMGGIAVLNLTSGQYRFQVFDSVSGNSLATALGATLGVWESLYCEYDDTTKTASISLNNGALTPAPLSLSNGVKTDNTTFFVGAGLGTYWDGLIQALGRWNKKLTETERTWLHNSGVSARFYSDLQAYTG